MINKSCSNAIGIISRFQNVKTSKCNQFLKGKYVAFLSDNIGGNEVVNVKQVIKAWTIIIPIN